MPDGALPICRPALLDLFERLKDAGPNMAFAVTRKRIEDEQLGDPATWPEPDYQHGIWRDPYTDNYMVVRAKEDGTYCVPHENMERVR